MKHPLALALAVALAATAPAYAQSEANAAVSDQAKPASSANPFFADSPLPLHYPQFDKIKDADFGPAFDRGMADQLKEIDAIANDPAKPTFDNTIIAMEKSGRTLSRATTVFYNLVGADTNDTRDKIDARVFAEVRRAPRRDLPQSKTVRAHQGAVRHARARSAWMPKARAWSRSTTRISCAPARSCPMPTRSSSRR